MMQTIYYDFNFTTLNEYINAERRNKFIAAKIKKTETNYVAMFSKNKLKQMNKKVKVTFVWHEKNMRRDPDNVAFAKKFILDGLVIAGILENDGHKQIYSFEDRFVFTGTNGVEVIFQEVTDDT